ncbi:MAG: thioredoxin family protein [Candidatus Moraniibacteriota bacterium]
MKKIFTLFFFSSLLWWPFFGLQAEEKVNVYFFYGEGCPHCAKEASFFSGIEEKYPEMEIKSFEIYHNRENAKLLKEFGEYLGVDIAGVPFTVIGSKYFSGFDTASSTLIENEIKRCSNDGCPDALVGMKNKEKEIGGDEQKQEIAKAPFSDQKIELPLFGEIKLSEFSLPLLTLMIGFLDGFNPCAMWTLLFLISLLLGMNDRKRMWILGVAFIVSSAFVYFLFMSAWLNLFLFFGFIVWVRYLIGLGALAGGFWSVKRAFFTKKSGCGVMDNEKRQAVFMRMKDVVNKNNFWLALGGIVALAFLVNLVEVICSAGLPAIYTQVLALNELNVWQYYSYIALYILFFMLDDLFVFFAAMITLEMTGITTKYSRYSQMIGGVLMLIIGILLIFKPGWLMFG